LTSFLRIPLIEAVLLKLALLRASTSWGQVLKTSLCSSIIWSFERRGAGAKFAAVPNDWKSWKIDLDKRLYYDKSFYERLKSHLQKDIQGGCPIFQNAFFWLKQSIVSTKK
jgi:hypothetical protein